ncbi:hypothetical protein [Christiangramia sediminis]|uniref:Uncharacterized protein n=1 Tax=Christiangramia sediminis TaxID=2881336 RepID=A0A9X1RYD7_9FLAO|nr:hypothetical protein [Christiangramia sediminis]MCB7481624.1 hypothetical protein [Christiangramia sediminis]
MSFKRIFVFSFLLLAFFSSGQSQESGRQYSEEDENKIWYRVIDYLAAELTYEYILEFEEKKPLNEEEKASFDNYREQLANSTIDRPFAPNSLKEFMNKSFTRTYSNLTQEIYGFKKLESKTAAELFQKTDSLLVAVKSNLKGSNVYDKIKYNVYSELEKNEAKPDPIPLTPDVVSNNVSNSESFLPEWFFKALSAILFLTSMFFFFLYKNFRNEARELKNRPEQSSTPVKQSSRGEHNYNRKWNNGNDFLTKPQPSTRSEKSEKKPGDDTYSRERLNKNPSTKTQGMSDSKLQAKEKESLVEAAGSNDVKSETHGPMNKEVTYDHSFDNFLYAGKPTNDGWFKDAERLKGDNHIYELSLSNDSEAEFSLLELSKYMETEVINSPDDYLYRVCINENSNQEYRNEIITTKRGIAHKVDGKWKVNEEDKATIKFQ